MTIISAHSGNQRDLCIEVREKRLGENGFPRRIGWIDDDDARSARASRGDAASPSSRCWCLPLRHGWHCSCNEYSTHQPNVDDYFYAYLAHSIWHESIGFSTPARHHLLYRPWPGHLVAAYGADGGVFVQLPLLLLLVTGAYLLARTWIRPIPAALTALAVGINQAVISFAVMFHFSIAVTGAIIWIFYSYLRSDHLREPRWCIALGVALAALMLSRSMALSYAFPLLLLLSIDVVLDARRRRLRWATVFVTRRGRPPAGRTLVVGVGPLRHCTISSRWIQRLDRVLFTNRESGRRPSTGPSLGLA